MEETPIVDTQEAVVEEEVIVSETELTEEDLNVEGEETESEPVQEGGDKLKANERIQQEIGRRKAEEERARQLEQRINELETKFKSKDEPAYIEITPQVQAEINNALANIEQQRIYAELEGDYLKAAHFRKEFDGILQGLAENEKLMEQAKMTAQQRQAEQTKVKAINERAEFYRQANQISPEQWSMANNWFADQVQLNPTLGIQFREIADYQGPMAAVDWAVKYVQQNMQKPAEEATKQKMEQKTRLPGGTSQNTGQILNQVKTMKAQALKSGSSDDWAAYFATKRQLTK